MSLSKVIFKDGTRASIRRTRPEDAARINQGSYTTTSTGYFYLPDPQPGLSALERITTLRPEQGVSFVVETTDGEIVAYAFYHIADSRLPVVAKPAFMLMSVTSTVA